MRLGDRDEGWGWGIGMRVGDSVTGHAIMFVI